MRKKVRFTITAPGEKTIIGEDDYGDPIYGVTDREIEVHSVQPALVDEADGTHRWVTTEMDVFSYGPLDLSPTGTIEYQGSRWQVHGPPASFTNEYTGTRLTKQRIKQVGGGR